RSHMVAGIEALQMKIRFSPGTPQPQGIHAGATPADDGRVVGDGPHAFGPVPEMSRLLARPFGGQCHDAAAKADQVADLGSLELPGIAEVQPGLGLLVLPAVDNGLAEQAMVVADAVAVGGD